jgi:large subunit ribosomal protein L21
MYAVLKTGGKQYKVAENDVIIVEKLVAEAGSNIDLDEVLMIGDGEASTVGTPTIVGAKVTAEVLEQKRGKKVIVFKKKRRQNYRRTRGHRQELTVLRITDILSDGKKNASKVRAKAKEAPAEVSTADVAPEVTENKE